MPRTATIDGKRYTIADASKNKKYAETRAANLRKQGYLARVIEPHVAGRCKYEVYKRGK